MLFYVVHSAPVVIIMTLLFEPGTHSSRATTPFPNRLHVYLYNYVHKLKHTQLYVYVHIYTVSCRIQIPVDVTWNPNWVVCVQGLVEDY